MRWLWNTVGEPLFRGWADHPFAVAEFWLHHFYLPHVRNPRSLSEHLLRMKISGALVEPLRQFISDKEHVKTYVAATVGAAHNVPTYAILRSPEEDESFDYPADCMVKPTHLSGRHLIRRGANGPPDTDKIQSWLKLNKYRNVSREANYRYLRPKIIVEELLLFDDALRDDYKIHCFHGRPKLFHVMPNRATHPICGTLYTDTWQRLEFTIQGPSRGDVPKPAILDEMIAVAARLSAPFDYVRVDLYTDGKRVYVGEMTNLPANANLSFRPREADFRTRSFFAAPDQDAANLYAGVVA